jgi:hypothetical protein
MTVVPTLTQVQEWDAGHLDAAADVWTVRAHKWENSYNAVLAGVACPGGTPWHGTAADAAAQRIDADRRAVIGAADRLRDAAAAARAGAEEIRTVRQLALDKVAAARGAGFDVDDDLSIVDPTTSSRASRVGREAAALMHARGVWNAADILVATDDAVARRIATAAIDLQDLRFASGHDTDLPQTLLAGYGEQLPPLPATPHLIYCYPSAGPEPWWCEGHGIGTGSYEFDSPWDLSGVA